MDEAHAHMAEGTTRQGRTRISSSEPKHIGRERVQGRATIQAYVLEKLYMEHIGIKSALGGQLVHRGIRTEHLGVMRYSY